MNDEFFEKNIVYIVENNDVANESLKSALKKNGFMVRHYENSEQLLLALENNSDNIISCALLDITFPDAVGADIKDKLIEGGYDIPIAYITNQPEIPAAVDAIKKGIFDYIQIPCAPEIICLLVEKMLTSAHQIQGRNREKNSMQSKLNLLSPRETEVFNLILCGHTNKEAAHFLSVSIKTIEAHRGKIMNKLGVNTAIGLLRMAINHQRVK